MDAGLDRDRVLLTSVDLHNANYSPQRRLEAVGQMLEKLRALPGVASASVSIIAPVCGCVNSIEAATEAHTGYVHYNRVSDGYFATLGIPLVAGRDFDRHDTPGSPKVAVINQTMAKQFFGGMYQPGRFYRPRNGNSLGDPVEIVGLVKDSKYASLRERVPPTIYAAWSQNAKPNPLLNFELRTAAGAPSSLIAGVKSAIGAVDPAVSFEFTTLASKIDESLSRERLLAALAALFGAIALILAAVGLYGMMSYTMSRRRHEIGIRMALGAGQGRVMRMVLGEVTLLAGIGLAVGLGAAAATTRFMGSFLYGLEPNDPLTFGLAAGVLAGVTLIAGYSPARRASLQSPMIALRDE
jgi:predicted permease